MTLTADTTVIAEKIKDLLLNNKDQLELIDVYRGDPTLIPTTPSVAVSTAVKRREFKGQGTSQYRVIVGIDVIVYFDKVGEVELAREECERIAEGVDTFLSKTNRNLDGLVIHGFVTRFQFGIAPRPDGNRQAVRLQWEGLTQESIT